MFFNFLFEQAARLPGITNGKADSHEDEEEADASPTIPGQAAENSFEKRLIGVRLVNRQQPQEQRDDDE